MLLREDLELSTLLSNVIKEACSVTGARYGALGILNEQGTEIEEFLTVGLTDEEERRIGPRPTGKGALGLLLTDPRSLRLARLDTQPESSGFPLHHPTMTSFLGVPIEVRDEIYGSLYLTDKLGAPEFTAEDEALVEALAAAAGMAIENARLHQRIQELAVIEDRDRMARDLHDTVVQHLYAVGITLETMAREPEAASLADRLAVLVADVGDAIRQVRSSIYELGLDEEDPGARASVIALVRSLAPVLGFKAKVLFNGPIDTVISQSVAEQLLATIREAVTNVGRHAQATETSVTVSAAGGLCRLKVIDNGVGVERSAGTGVGLGLANLRQRAERLHGGMSLVSRETGGTELEWWVPISQ